MNSPTLDRFTVSSAGRELALFFSEGVAALSALQPSALSLSLAYKDTRISSAKLLCSSAELGRRRGSSSSASRREILLRLDEPCATVNTTSSSSNATSSNATTAHSASDLTDDPSLEDRTNATAVTAGFVGGYSSDWSKLVAAGVLLEDDGGGSALRNETEGVSLFLNVTPEFVTDLSALANPVVAVENLTESFPGKSGKMTEGTRRAPLFGLVYFLFFVSHIMCAFEYVMPRKTTAPHRVRQYCCKDELSCFNLQLLALFQLKSTERHPSTDALLSLLLLHTCLWLFIM